MVNTSNYLDIPSFEGEVNNSNLTQEISISLNYNIAKNKYRNNNAR